MASNQTEEDREEKKKKGINQEGTNHQVGAVDLAGWRIEKRNNEKTLKKPGIF